MYWVSEKTYQNRCAHCYFLQYVQRLIPRGWKIYIWLASIPFLKPCVGRRLDLEWWTHTIYRWCVIEFCTWNLHNCINECHPNKFNKIFNKNTLQGHFYWPSHIIVPLRKFKRLFGNDYFIFNCSKIYLCSHF